MQKRITKANIEKCIDAVLDHKAFYTYKTADGGDCDVEIRKLKNDKFMVFFKSWDNEHLRIREGNTIAISRDDMVKTLHLAFSGWRGKVTRIVEY